jgi:hypothetical protein
VFLSCRLGRFSRFNRFNRFFWLGWFDRLRGSGRLGGRRRFGRFTAELSGSLLGCDFVAGQALQNLPALAGACRVRNARDGFG